MKKNVFICLWFLLIGTKVVSQSSDSTQNKSNSSNLKIFLEGVGEWENYIKVSLWYVDYVRDPRLADIQVIVASQITGGGGSFYHLFFIGRGKYEGRNDTLTMNAPIEYTNKKTRDELTNVITMGLMPYLARNGQSKYMLFDFTDRQRLVQQSMDKWKNWIYTIQANGNFSGNKTTQIIAASANLSASHVTNKWKQKISGGISFNNNQYETSTYSFNGTTLIKNINLLAVKSYGEHFSAGLESGYYSSTFSNIR